LQFVHQLTADSTSRTPAPLRIAFAGKYRVPELSMSALFPRTLLRIPSFTKAIALGLLLVPPAGSARAAESITVLVDQAKLIKLPEKVATIVVGNPLIADVSLQPGGTMVVTGRGYGSTNVVVLDRQGTVLVDRMVQVEGAIHKLVTVYRGVERESYSCTPDCQRRVTLGDSQAYFTAVLAQGGALTSQAAPGAQTPQASGEPVR
jgi:Flp pilus assembly secretin CpaC